MSTYVREQDVVDVDVAVKHFDNNEGSHWFSTLEIKTRVSKRVWNDGHYVEVRTPGSSFDMFINDPADLDLIIEKLHAVRASLPQPA